MAGLIGIEGATDGGIGAEAEVLSGFSGIGGAAFVGIDRAGTGGATDGGVGAVVSVGILVVV